MTAAQSAREWDAYLRRAKAQHGDRLDLSQVSDKFRRFFKGPRLRVDFGVEEPWVLTGTVGITTGWKPVLLLIRRSDSMGSSDTLSDRDTILAVQSRGRTYVPVANLASDPNDLGPTRPTEAISARYLSVGHVTGGQRVMRTLHGWGEVKVWLQGSDLDGACDLRFNHGDPVQVAR